MTPDLDLRTPVHDRQQPIAIATCDVRNAQGTRVSQTCPGVSLDRARRLRRSLGRYMAASTGAHRPPQAPRDHHMIEHDPDRDPSIPGSWPLGASEPRRVPDVPERSGRVARCARSPDAAWCGFVCVVCVVCAACVLSLRGSPCTTTPLALLYCRTGEEGWSGDTLRSSALLGQQHVGSPATAA